MGFSWGKFPQLGEFLYILKKDTNFVGSFRDFSSFLK
jgi:hypothetical protein